MEQLDNKKITLGQLISVKNTQKKSIENDKYIAVQIEDFDGNNEQCILFTENEVSNMENISADWLIDYLKAGRLYPIVINKKETNLLKIIDSNDEEKVLRVSNKQLSYAKKRAQRNPEDLTEKSLLTDLFD